MEEHDSLDHSVLSRRVRGKKPTLFDLEPEWQDHWWSMPSMEMGDARPVRRLTVNFMSQEDMEDFAKRLGVSFTPKTNSLWWPPQRRFHAQGFEFVGPKATTRYPVYIPSKGRADCQLTGKVFDELGINYKFVVECTEEREYVEALGRDKVLVLPFHDLGKGSIPARNWIWDHAEKTGAAWHWVVDDNIVYFARTTCNRRVVCRTGMMFRAMEDWVDRYENVALAGPHHTGFVPDREYRSPFLLNHRVYSCILVRTDLPYRWRGKYNEDTDLSLRVLKDGWVTVLFRAFIMCKTPTMTMKGGNTDNVYNQPDYRLEFARSLQQQHPDVVKVVWRFNRWHHHVDYTPFRRNQLRLKPGVVPTKSANEYEMRLVRKKKSAGK